MGDMRERLELPDGDAPDSAGDASAAGITTSGGSAILSSFSAESFIETKNPTNLRFMLYN
jgi:hypothetical protein